MVDGAVPLCVISPHLDDGVLSCGRLLAARPGSVVLTALGGDPPDPTARAHGWDRTSTGARRAGAAVARRRAEDERAVGLLGCRAARLAWSEYHNPSPTADELADELARVLGELGRPAVAGPVGLLHPHHLLVNRAVVEVAHRWPEAGRAWYLYADTPYGHDHPDELERRLTALGRRVGLEEVAMDQAPAARRVEAAAAYASQLPVLRTVLEGTDAALCTTERYWRLTVGAGGPGR